MKISSTALATLALFLAGCAHAGEKIEEIDAGNLNGLSKAPKTIPAEKAPEGAEDTEEFIAKGSKKEEVIFDFVTKAARIVSKPDGTKVESPLVEIPLLFNQGQATLREDAQSQANLRALAAALLKVEAQGGRFTIAGFASAEGDAAENQKLSEDRATTVRTALILLGVKPETLEKAGFGARFAKAPADAPEEQLAPDRKVVAVREK